MSKDPVFPKCYVNVGDGAFIEAIPQPKDVIEKLEREIEELHSLLQKTGEHPNRQLTSAPELSAEQNTLQAWLDKNYPAEKWSKYQRDLLSVAWNAALDSIKSKPEWGSVEHYDAAWSAFGGDKFADLHEKLSIDHIRRLFTMFAQCADLTARDEFAKEKAALSQQWLDWGVKRRDEGIEAVLNDEALHLSDRQRSRVRNLKGQP